MVYDTVIISQCGRFTARIHHSECKDCWCLLDTGKTYLSQTFAIKNARMHLCKKRKKNPLKKKKVNIKVKRRTVEKTIWKEVKLYDVQF